MKIIKLVKSLFKKFKYLDSYNRYLELQKARSLSRYNKTNSIEYKRKKYCIELLSKSINLELMDSALVVGCRNVTELNLLSEKGIKNTVGIDLYSFDERVLVMDMHKLDFPDDHFDLIYCSHALEHALYPHKVIYQFVRKIKNKGKIFIEVPINFEVRGADLHDFKSYSTVIDFFKMEKDIKVNEILLKDIKKGEQDNFQECDISRILIELKKQ